MRIQILRTVLVRLPGGRRVVRRGDQVEVSDEEAGRLSRLGVATKLPAATPAPPAPEAAPPASPAEAPVAEPPPEAAEHTAATESDAPELPLAPPDPPAPTPGRSRRRDMRAED